MLATGFGCAVERVSLPKPNDGRNILDAGSSNVIAAADGDDDGSLTGDFVADDCCDDLLNSVGLNVGRGDKLEGRLDEWEAPNGDSDGSGESGGCDKMQCYDQTFQVSHPCSLKTYWSTRHLGRRAGCV